MALAALGPDFDDFVRGESAGLLRTAFLLTGDRGHAEDLLQTALLRTARRWASARQHPAAYTRRVLVNLAKDRWRQRGRRVPELARPLDLEPSHDGSQGEILLRQVLLPAVMTLPTKQRAVLVLRFLDDLSVDETADALGCSAGTVKSQTHHALARLRGLLGDGIVTDTRTDITEMEIDHAER